MEPDCSEVVPDVKTSQCGVLGRAACEAQGGRDDSTQALTGLVERCPSKRLLKRYRHAPFGMNLLFPAGDLGCEHSVLVLLLPSPCLPTVMLPGRGMVMTLSPRN